jgi:hypothetical protein
MTWSIPAIPLRIGSSTELATDLTTETGRARGEESSPRRPGLPR